MLHLWLCKLAAELLFTVHVHNLANATFPLYRMVLWYDDTDAYPNRSSLPEGCAEALTTLQDYYVLILAKVMDRRLRHMAASVFGNSEKAVEDWGRRAHLPKMCTCSRTDSNDLLYVKDF